MIVYDNATCYINSIASDQLLYITNTYSTNSELGKAANIDC